MAGFANDANLKEILQCDNVDFSGNAHAVGQIVSDGQLLIGSSVAPNIRPANLTAGAGISITNGSGTITITNTGGGGGGGIGTLNGNLGAAAGVGGVINVLGSGSLTTTGAGMTLTIGFTGLTNHAVLVASSSSLLTNVGPSATSGQILQSQGALADPSFSTATYPSTTTINQLLFSSSNNVIGGIAAANSGILVSTSTGVPQWSGTMTNGQLIIGNTGGTPTATTLTQGTGITITNGGGTITIAQTNPSGFPWTDVTGASQTLAINSGFVTDRAGGVTYTLPATASLGDTMLIVGKAGLATITPNANQQIEIGSASGTVGVTGTAISNNAGDCITLICITAGASTVWRANTVIGTWTLN